MSYSRQLLQIDFDQFYRYAAIATLLKPLICAANAPLRQPIRILEVGSNCLNLLPAFLAPLPIEIVRSDLQEDFDDGIGPYVQLAANQPVPFADNSFDYIVALEVLEHISKEERRFALTEWARVSRHAVILSCPNGRRVRYAEKRADRAYRMRHENKPHPWLEEHERFGQPRPHEVRDLLREAKLIHHGFANSPLAEWLPLLLATEEVLEHGSPDLVKRFNEMLNVRPFRAFIRKNAYRRIYIGFKEEAQAQQAQQLWHQELPPSRSIDPVRYLARRFTQLLKEGQANIVRGEQLQTLQRSVNEYRFLVDESRKQSNLLRWTLESCGSWKAHVKRSWRSLLRRLGLLSFRFSAPDEVHQLIPPVHPPHSKEGTEGCWYATGNDPQFIWNSSYHSGWHRVLICGQALANQQAKLYLDYGDGFTERGAFLLDYWPPGPARIDRYIYFHRPVKRIRLDPAADCTPVQLLKFAIQRRTSWRVAIWGTGRFLKDLVCRPRTNFKAFYDAVRRRRLREFIFEQACGPHAKVVFSDNAYQTWLFAQRPSNTARQAIADQLSSTCSMAIMLSLPKQWTLREVRTTVKSLLGQVKEGMEIWLIASKEEQASLLKYAEIEAIRSKIHWLIVDGATPLSKAYHQCLERIAASHCLPLQLGDELEPDAITQLLAKAGQHPQAVIIYSDEDHYNKKHEYTQPLLKPDQAPESFYYRPLLAGYSAALNCQQTLEVGGFHPAYEGALLAEFFHRVLKQGQEVAHVRRVLIHHPISRPLSHGQRLVHERLVDEQRQLATASSPAQDAFISIIIPSAGRMTTIHGKVEMYLARCLSSIRHKSTFQNYEIIVVNNETLSHEAQTVIAHFGAQRTTVPGPFNFSRSINAGAKAVRGNHLLLLNDDTEVISSDWLQKLLFFSRQPGIGAVGAKLFFPTGALQHVGIALSPAGPGHPYYGAPRETTGYLNCCFEPRNWLAVTGACLMTPRRAFDAVRGLDESFDLNYNDVDYCLRLWQAGYRSVCDPSIELYHYETMRADGRMKFRPEELQRFNARWQKTYPYDPYFASEPC